jgi:glycosyltransferase involved in cell wall biosynthesis
MNTPEPAGVHTTNSESSGQLPLVSVIIPCYNHASYLHESIPSILNQTYKNIEIIVIDDGSKDNTREVALSYPGVKCVTKKNEGLSAARNTGIEVSRGDYLMFIDADDLYYPEAVETNLKYFLQHTECAFVAGHHEKVDGDRNIMPMPEHIAPSEDHFIKLLRVNYIGMPAEVMYKRQIFEHFRFDTSLRACEDYDMYLKISRKYPIFTHSEKIASYRIHGNNMSANSAFMLSSVRLVLRRIRLQLTEKREIKAYNEGWKLWRNYYAVQAIKKLNNKKLNNPKLRPPTRQELFVALRYKPYMFAMSYLSSITEEVLMMFGMA